MKTKVKPGIARLITMAVPLTRRCEKPWRLGSHTGEFLYETSILTPDEIIERNEELTYVASKRKRHALINGHLSHDQMGIGSGLREHRASDDQIKDFAFANFAMVDWLKRMGEMSSPAVWDRISKSGHPVGTTGSYAGPGALSNTAALSAVTGGVANVLWWSPLVYSALPAANGIKAPASYRLTAGGLITSSASAQTLILNTSIGTAVGTNLAVGSSLALGTTITNAFWRAAFDATIRSVSATSSVVGNGLFHWGTTAGASSTVSNALWGGGNTVASVDLVTAQQALAFGATPSATGVSITPTIIQWASWD